MRREGTLAPETWAAARERFEAYGPTAQTVVREVAKAMEFGREEYDERVTSEVTETARQAIFAEQLAVRVDDAEGFEAWRAETDHEVRASNDRARALYREFGFETHHVIPGYYDDGEDAHVMVRGR